MSGFQVLQLVLAGINGIRFLAYMWDRDTGRALDSITIALLFVAVALEP